MFSGDCWSKAEAAAPEIKPLNTGHCECVCTDVCVCVLVGGFLRFFEVESERRNNDVGKTKGKHLRDENMLEQMLGKYVMRWNVL